MESNPDKPWDYVALSCNPNITGDFILANPDKPWNYFNSTRFNNITWENYKSNPNLWDYSALRANWSEEDILESIKSVHLRHPASHKCSWEIIRDNTNINWYRASWNPNVTMDIVKNNMHLPWNASSLLDNPNITWEFIRNGPIKWNRAHLVICKVATLDVVRENISFWDGERISRNPNLTWEFINEFPDYPWDYKYISYRIRWSHASEREGFILEHMRGITWKVVRDNYDLFDFGRLSSAKFA